MLQVPRVNYRKNKSKTQSTLSIVAFYDSVFRPKHPKKISTALIPHNFFDSIGYLKPPKSNQSSYLPIETSTEADIEIETISDQLSTILLKDEQVLLNKTGRLPNQKPRWPITTTRDQHQDGDVFLARANNPFGHSTKWKYTWVVATSFFLLCDREAKLVWSRIKWNSYETFAILMALKHR